MCRSVEKSLDIGFRFHVSARSPRSFNSSHRHRRWWIFTFFPVDGFLSWDGHGAIQIPPADRPRWLGGSGTGRRVLCGQGLWW